MRDATKIANSEFMGQITISVHDYFHSMLSKGVIYMAGSLAQCGK